VDAMEFLKVLSSIFSNLVELMNNEIMFVFVCSMSVVALALLVALAAIKKSGD